MSSAPHVAERQRRIVVNAQKLLQEAKPKLEWSRCSSNRWWRNMEKYVSKIIWHIKKRNRKNTAINNYICFLDIFLWLSRHIMMYPICIYIYIYISLIFIDLPKGPWPEGVRWVLAHHEGDGIRRCLHWSLGGRRMRLLVLVCWKCRINWLTWMKPPSRGSMILPPWNLGAIWTNQEWLGVDSIWLTNNHWPPPQQTNIIQHPRSGDHLPGKQSSQPFRVR